MTKTLCLILRLRNFRFRSKRTKNAFSNSGKNLFSIFFVRFARNSHPRRCQHVTVDLDHPSEIMHIRLTLLTRDSLCELVWERSHTVSRQCHDRNKIDFLSIFQPCAKIKISIENRLIYKLIDMWSHFDSVHCVVLRLFVIGSCTRWARWKFWHIRSAWHCCQRFGYINRNRS